MAGAAQLSTSKSTRLEPQLSWQKQLVVLFVADTTRAAG